MDRTAVMETKTEISRIENIPYFISGYNIYNRHILQSIVRLLKCEAIEPLFSSRYVPVAFWLEMGCD